MVILINFIDRIQVPTTNLDQIFDQNGQFDSHFGLKKPGQSNRLRLLFISLFASEQALKGPILLMSNSSQILHFKLYENIAYLEGLIDRGLVE